MKDYGSTWEGNIVIRNCSILPTTSDDVTIIKGSNKGDHNFGYTCYMPTNVRIDGLYVDDTNDVYVFSNFNTKCKSKNYKSKYPYHVTKKVKANNIVLENPNKKLKLSLNPYLFAKTKFYLE